MSHIHLAGGQEVLHGHGTARIAALVELALHELARRDDLVDLVVAVMVFQELRLQERESAFGFGTLHASLLHSMDETSIKAVVAHLAVAVHHGVCRAQQNVVMCGVHHWHTMLLQVRRIQNRQCQLTVHVVHVDHIRLELLQQRLKQIRNTCSNSLARCSGAAWRRRQLRGLMISGLRRVRKSRFRHRLCGRSIY